MKALSTWANVEAKELMKTAKSRVEWRGHDSQRFEGARHLERERDMQMKCNLKVTLYSSQSLSIICKINFIPFDLLRRDLKEVNELCSNLSVCHFVMG